MTLTGFGSTSSLSQFRKREAVAKCLRDDCTYAGMVNDEAIEALWGAPYDSNSNK